MSTPLVATFSIVVAEEVQVPVSTIAAEVVELDEILIEEPIMSITQEETDPTTRIDEQRLVAVVEDE